MIRFAYRLKLLLIILFSIMLLALPNSDLHPVCTVNLAFAYILGIRLLWKSAARDAQKLQWQTMKVKHEKATQQSFKINHAA